MNFEKYLKEIFKLHEKWERSMCKMGNKYFKGEVSLKKYTKIRDLSYNKIYNKYCAKNIMKGNQCVTTPPEYCTKGIVIKIIEKNDKFVTFRVKAKTRLWHTYFRIKFIKKKWLIDKIFRIDDGKKVRVSF